VDFIEVEPVAHPARERADFLLQRITVSTAIERPRRAETGDDGKQAKERGEWRMIERGERRLIPRQRIGGVLTGKSFRDEGDDSCACAAASERASPRNATNTRRSM